MFKVGEKYLCKKSSPYSSDNIMVIINNYYEIVSINTHCYYFKVNNFTMIFDDGYLGDWCINEHFYTNKEYRKIKLERICLNQEI